MFRFTLFDILNFGLAVFFLGQISSAAAMSISSSGALECAVVGCGVLGTSLCKQMIESPEFSSWKGMINKYYRRVYLGPSE
jgi:hypothetical protein